MIDGNSGAILVLHDLLQRVVPMVYLAMALYLGIEGSPRRVWNWAYIVTFGGFGVGAYMILNEPGYSWVPIWMTDEIWMTLALFFVLVLGVLLFIAAIELQDLDTPTESLQDLYNWIAHRVFRIYNWLSRRVFKE